MKTIENRKLVKFHGKNYYVLPYLNKGVQKLFLIDEQDLENVINASRTWYQVNGYIGFDTNRKNIRASYYLHNIVMCHDPSDSGATVDHINRIKTDNRKSNLRLATQTQQNENQTRRERTAKLPEGCGITIDELPKCVTYHPPNSGHGAVFVLELRKNGKRTTFKSTSSTKVSLRDKLAEIKQIILRISNEYPELMTGKCIIENYSDEQIILMNEYNKIIERSGFDCAKDNLIDIPKKAVMTTDVSSASAKTQKYLQMDGLLEKTGKMHRNDLPDKSEITQAMIPKHCYYRKKSATRSDAFVVDKHPKLPQGVRQIMTDGSSKKTTEEKFEELIRILREIKKPENSRKTAVEIKELANCGILSNKTSNRPRNKISGSKTANPAKKSVPKKVINSRVIAETESDDDDIRTPQISHKSEFTDDHDKSKTSKVTHKSKSDNNPLRKGSASKSGDKHASKHGSPKPVRKSKVSGSKTSKTTGSGSKTNRPKRHQPISAN